MKGNEEVEEPIDLVRSRWARVPFTVTLMNSRTYVPEAEKLLLLVVGTELFLGMGIECEYELAYLDCLDENHFKGRQEYEAYVFNEGEFKLLGRPEKLRVRETLAWAYIASDIKAALRDIHIVL